jgi:guanine deaminase
MFEQGSEFAVLGTFIHAPSLGEVEIIDSALIVVDAAGKIDRILLDDDDDAFRTNREAAINAGRFTQLDQNQYLLPGLVDLHVHAPQWPQAGRALQLPLADWLNQCTFPLEARFADTQFAAGVYRSLVNTLLANGTTTAQYFASIHLEASVLLSEICLELGQRALVGKVSMDNVDQCPDFYREASTATGLADTEEFINRVESLSGNQSKSIKPVVTPRFIPSCTDEMLHGLADIAEQYDCRIQTHCSESDWEHQYVLDRFGKTDTECLLEMGLATSKSVFAHANLIEDTDLSIIHDAGVGIAHCPMSNVYFADSVFPVSRALNAGVNIGLGTDIAGGPSPSVLFNCQMAISMSRALESGVDGTVNAAQRGVPRSRISSKEAFWMATRGGGLALGEDIGIFASGYCFDAIVVDFDAEHSNIVAWPEFEGPDELLEKILFNANRQNISKVWVDGQLVIDHTNKPGAERI